MRAGLSALAPAAFICAALLWAADPNPITRVWRVNPQASNAALRSVLPDVHSVLTDGNSVHVQSAGLALQSLAPLDVNAVDLSSGVRKFDFRFPLSPRPGTGVPTPLGVLGAFVSGVPIYNVTSVMSWRDQNIWHQDAIAAAPSRSPLLAALLDSTGRHSPLIGFALDGFPIYGPWGRDEEGSLQRFRSSWRLRSLARRDILPDGTVLGPSQEGPPFTPRYPAGTFVEDYEYIERAGDLDTHNGRFAKTPEYPQGTYAYFLSTDSRGGLMYPYLVGPTYYGEIPLLPVPAGERPLDGDPSMRMTRLNDSLVFSIHDAKGRPVRYLERVHEKPIHLVIVSQDLKDFGHVHPELQPNDTFAVEYRFQKPGKYWLFADYTMPGKAQSISRFAVNVAGPRATPDRPVADREFTKSADSVRVTMRAPATLRAGEDLAFRFDLNVRDLEPYLGAWAHMMIVSADGRRFIHAHPADDAPLVEDPWQHSHAVPGPSPASVSTITGFERPGTYRLWFQFQREGKVTAVPFTFKVEASKTSAPAPPVPADAIRIQFSRAGFEPARVEVPPHKPVRLAFARIDAENCASSIVFPELNLRKALPAGRTTVIDLPAMQSRELAFGCGMGMYRGSVVVR